MSDLKFNCPHCQQRLGLPEAALGRTISCPICKGHIQLPKVDRPQTEPKSSQLVLVKREGGGDPNKQKSDIKFSCPKCQVHLVIEARGAGKRIACKNCGERVLVPDPRATISIPVVQPAAHRTIGKVDVKPIGELIEKARQGDEQAGKSLLEMGSPVIAAIIQGLKEDSLEEPNLSKGADHLTALIVKFGAASVKPLIAKLGKSRHAYLALGKIGTDEAIHALERELPSCNWRRVELACTALGLVNSPSILNILDPLDKLRRSTRSGEVYMAAGEAIIAIQNQFRT